MNHGYDPRLPTSFDVFRKGHPNAEKEPKDALGKCPGANDFFKRIQQSIVDAKRNLEMAQQKQKYYADLKRRPETDIDVHSEVLLSTKNLYIKKGSTKKLLPRYIGPLTVIEKINEVAFKLDLPKKLRMHNVFHVSLLRPYIEGKHPRSPPIPEILKGEFEYTVDQIIKHSLVPDGKKKPALEFLIRWKGYGSINDSWEPDENLTNCEKLVKKFKKEHKLSEDY